MHDAIVVGSGLAGTFAAYGLRGRDVLLLDVGHAPPEPPPQLQGNLYRLRKNSEDLFEPLIGGDFEGLHNVHRRNISLKLKGPSLAYIVRGAERLSPLRSADFEPVMSFARGGLANAWGAGVYRFTARELEDFPLAPGELDSFYDELTHHVGVSGANDDLVPFFGKETNLLPPLRLSAFATELLRSYEARKAFFQERGIYIGYPRLAVLTREHNGRAAYAYDSLEFFRPCNPAIYNPVFTLDEMIRAGAIRYRSGWLAERYRETDGAVEVVARDLSTGAAEKFRARRLLLAAGALNTTRLVLSSNADCRSRLPILDNRMSCLPLFRLGRIGAALDGEESTMGQLNVLCRDPESGDVLQATLYGAAGPLRSDILFQLPLTVSASLTWNKYLAPAMGVLLLFYPGKPGDGNYIKLDANGGLEAKYPRERTTSAEAALLKALRKAGFLGSTVLCMRPPMGSGIHYAGCLPMKAEPGPYQTYPDGRLFGTSAVYIVDGACFPSLPAKNLSFTMMANALRIASGVRRTLER